MTDSDAVFKYARNLEPGMLTREEGVILEIAPHSPGSEWFNVTTDRRDHRGNDSKFSCPADRLFLVLLSGEGAK